MAPKEHTLEVLKHILQEEVRTNGKTTLARGLGVLITQNFSAPSTNKDVRNILGSKVQSKSASSTEGSARMIEWNPSKKDSAMPKKEDQKVVAENNDNEVLDENDVDANWVTANQLNDLSEDDILEHFGNDITIIKDYADLLGLKINKKLRVKKLLIEFKYLLSEYIEENSEVSGHDIDYNEN